MSIEVEKTRIFELREYLLKVIDGITANKQNSINANMLSNNVDSYSLDKIPMQTKIEKWITGVEIHKDVYSFRSRRNYSIETLMNLQNIGFYELFTSEIRKNNKKGDLPNILGIENIECLNCGSMVNATTNTAEFDIQIQITYKEV